MRLSFPPPPGQEKTVLLRCHATPQAEKKRSFTMGKHIYVSALKQSWYLESPSHPVKMESLPKVWGVWTPFSRGHNFTFLPINGVSIEPLKVKLLAGEQKAAETRLSQPRPRIPTTKQAWPYSRLGPVLFSTPGLLDRPTFGFNQKTDCWKACLFSLHWFAL